MLTVSGAVDVWIIYRDTKNILLHAHGEKADAAARRVEKFLADLERRSAGRREMAQRATISAGTIIGAFSPKRRRSPKSMAPARRAANRPLFALTPFNEGRRAGLPSPEPAPYGSVLRRGHAQPRAHGKALGRLIFPGEINVADLELTDPEAVENQKLTALHQIGEIFGQHE